MAGMKSIIIYKARARVHPFSSVKRFPTLRTLRNFSKQLTIPDFFKLFFIWGFFRLFISTKKKSIYVIFFNYSTFIAEYLFKRV